MSEEAWQKVVRLESEVSELRNWLEQRDAEILRYQKMIRDAYYGEPDVMEEEAWRLSGENDG